MKRLGVLAALLLAACASDPHAPKTVVAGPQGGDVTVEHGQRLLFRLPADADWRRVEPEIPRVIPQGPRNADTWMFTPVRTGEENLTFASGEKKVTYRVTVPPEPSELLKVIWWAPPPPDTAR